MHLRGDKTAQACVGRVGPAPARPQILGGFWPGRSDSGSQVAKLLEEGLAVSGRLRGLRGGRETRGMPGEPGAGRNVIAIDCWDSVHPPALLPAQG